MYILFTRTEQSATKQVRMDLQLEAGQTNLSYLLSAVNKKAEC